MQLVLFSRRPSVSPRADSRPRVGYERAIRGRGKLTGAWRDENLMRNTLGDDMKSRLFTRKLHWTAVTSGGGGKIVVSDYSRDSGFKRETASVYSPLLLPNQTK